MAKFVRFVGKDKQRNVMVIREFRYTDSIYTKRGLLRVTVQKAIMEMLDSELTVSMETGEG